MNTRAGTVVPAEVVRLIKGELPNLLRGGTPAAIGVQGGIVRGRMDQYSDIDLVFVFSSNADVRDAIRGKHTDMSGTVWGLHHLRVANLALESWPDARRYVYGYETIPLDDPSGCLASIRDQVQLSQKELHLRTAYLLHKLALREVIYPSQLGVPWRGFKLDDADPWSRRGDYYSAHMRLNQAHDLLVSMIYTVNCRPRPSGKSVHSILHSLPWFPSDVKNALAGLALVATLDDAEYQRRKSCAHDILVACVDRGANIGIVDDNVSERYYSSNGSHLDDADANHPGKPR